MSICLCKLPIDWPNESMQICIREYSSHSWLDVIAVALYAGRRHQMKAFSALLTLCLENHRPPVDSLHKDQWRKALMFSLICTERNGCANNRDAGDLRRHRAYYDVIVMVFKITQTCPVGIHIVLVFYCHQDYINVWKVLFAFVVTQSIIACFSRIRELHPYNTLNTAKLARCAIYMISVRNSS